VLTRIELDGFKTFQNFKLELASFQVIIGGNGAGKSNLFDALRLLSRLAQFPLDEAFQDPQARGSGRELFTLGYDNQSIPNMRIAVEMLLDHDLESILEPDAPKYRRLRYELTVTYSYTQLGLGQFYVAHESLASIPREKDRWLNRYIGKNSAVGWPVSPVGPSKLFIETDQDQSAFLIHPDGEQSPVRQPLAIDGRGSTLLKFLSTPLFPHAYAVYQELTSCRFLLQLDPDVLRRPSPNLRREQLGIDGAGLAAVLARMQAEDPSLLDDVSRDLANLVPGALGVEVQTDEARGESTVSVRMQDNRAFSSYVLSDGTLRLLALITLKNDPHYRGMLCLEEPENGVHPLRLKDLAQLLRALATDFSDPGQATEPLRQVLINTHSPALVSALSKTSGGRPEIVFAYMITHLPGEYQLPIRITHMVPVTADRRVRKELEIDDPEGAYTLKQVLDYLESTDTGEASVLRGKTAR